MQNAKLTAPSNSYHSLCGIKTRTVTEQIRWTHIQAKWMKWYKMAWKMRWPKGWVVFHDINIVAYADFHSQLATTVSSGHYWSDIVSEIFSFILQLSTSNCNPTTAGHTFLFSNYNAKGKFHSELLGSLILNDIYRQWLDFHHLWREPRLRYHYSTLRVDFDTFLPTVFF